MEFIGNFLVQLALWTALLGSYFHIKLYLREDFEQLAKTSLFTHIFSVFSTGIFLYYLLFTHQYQFHYVWSHTSNELPWYYIFSAIWEGQEGSFLLWATWNSVILLFINKSNKKWKSIVIAIILSIQAMLISMLVGVYLKPIYIVLLGTMALLGIYLFNIKNNEINLTGKILFFAFLILSLIISIINKNISLDYPYNYLLGLLGVIFFGYISYKRVYPFRFILLLLFSGVLFYLSIMGSGGEWKIGSSPFILLKEVFRDAPIFQNDPDFVPANGKGLNPLLQNYWMVIHPPVLFLGFALSSVPFGIVIYGLITNRSSEWISSAIFWLVLTALVLGTGIILGGYWAYETLSFGGYWAWDPVENSSLVPWITTIASIHTLLSYQRKKINYSFSIILIIATFVLVLYSTFLTRSGILGDSSVHSFTDLGLSGQLLILLLSYLITTLLLYFYKSANFPEVRNIKLNSNNASLWLTVGAIILTFVSFEITIATSLPVINKIIGSNFAMPSSAPLFYYKSTFWAAIIILLIIAFTPFLFWYNYSLKKVLKELQLPFFISLILTIGIQALALYYKRSFIYDKIFYESGVIGKFLMLSDDLLVFASLFASLSMIKLAVNFIKRNKNQLKLLGGTLAHIGFSLIILGALFSSGYENILSQTSVDEEKDNVFLPVFRANYIKGYEVTYLGKEKARLPVKKVNILYQDQTGYKFLVLDKINKKYSFTLPKDFLPSSKDSIKFALERLKELINLNPNVIPLVPLNERNVYRIRFRNLEDTSKVFYLYPEAQQSENMGLIVHPDRKITLTKDLYVHITSIPKQSGKLVQKIISIVPGDTASLGDIVFYLKEITQLPSDTTEFKAKATIMLYLFGKVAKAEPIMIIKNNQIFYEDDYIEALSMNLRFMGIDTENGKVILAVSFPDYENDFISLKVIEKPFINILWLGTFLLFAGFSISIYRRL